VKCKEKGDITEKALTFKFLYRLPQNAKIKAMRFVTKGTKFDPNNIKSFEEIYSNVKSNCVVLRDMDEIV